MITINGHTDALPKVTTSVAGLGDDLSLQEGTASSGAQDFSLQAQAGVGSITLDFTSGGVPSSVSLTLAQLRAWPGSPRRSPPTRVSWC